MRVKLEKTSEASDLRGEKCEAVAEKRKHDHFYKTIFESDNHQF